MIMTIVCFHQYLQHLSHCNLVIWSSASEKTVLLIWFRKTDQWVKWLSCCSALVPNPLGLLWNLRLRNVGNGAMLPWESRSSLNKLLGVDFPLSSNPCYLHLITAAVLSDRMLLPVFQEWSWAAFWGKRAAWTSCRATGTWASSWAPASWPATTPGSSRPRRSSSNSERPSGENADKPLTD